MNVISSSYLKKEGNSSASATYIIVIKDFKKKLAKTAVGKRSSSTEEFYVNWSKFSILLYIDGWKEESKGNLSLFLYNRSDWMVRGRFEVSVKVMNKIERLKK